MFHGSFGNVSWHDLDLLGVCLIRWRRC